MEEVYPPPKCHQLSAVERIDRTAGVHWFRLNAVGHYTVYGADPLEVQADHLGVAPFFEMSPLVCVTMDNPVIAAGVWLDPQAVGNPRYEHTPSDLRDLEDDW